MYSGLDPGKMSVYKFWAAGAPDKAAEFTAETTKDAISPVGLVRRESDGTILEPDSINEGLTKVIHVASLCNVATYVCFSLVKYPPHSSSIAYTRT